MTTYKVGYLIGSLSSTSINRKLANALIKLAPSTLSFSEIPFRDLPIYSPDYDADFPAPGKALKEAIKAVDALLFVTPEYNRSIPGGLKNAIDWASRKGPDDRAPLDGKTVAMMGAGGMYGTLRAQLHLREILSHNQTYVMARPELMVARAGQYFDEDGRLTDEAMRLRLDRLLGSLRDWTRLVQN